MNAALVGSAVGFFLAAGGLGFLFLLALKGITVYRRWPRASHGVSSLFVLIVGFFTAYSETNPDLTLTYIIATLGAAGVVAFYKLPPTGAPTDAN